MHGILFSLGLLTSAAGFVAIGFGIPVNAFSLGNTLIIAGTIAVVGGFILIALASAVGHLKRIAEGENLHAPLMPLPHEPADQFRPRAQPALQPNHGLPPPLKPDAIPRAPASPEPKLTISPSAELEQLAWLRPKNAQPTFGEQAVIAEMEASLSPGSPTSPPPPSSPRLVSPAPPTNPPPEPKAHEPPFEPRPALRSQPTEPMVEADPASQVESGARPAPSVEHQNSSGLFETVWPEIRPARNPETIARAHKPDAATMQREDGRSAKNAPREPQAPPPDEPRQVAILKSGMIDGMAYTLYADGSIEAVLASGPIRFASIDALRIHLEKNG